MADDHKCVSIRVDKSVVFSVTNTVLVLLRPLYLSQLSSWQLGLLEKAVAPPNRLYRWRTRCFFLSNQRSSTPPSPVKNKIFPRFQCSMSSGSIVPGAMFLVYLGEGWHRLADPSQRSVQSLLLRPLTDHKRRLCLKCDHKIRYNKFNSCLFDFSSTWRQP